MPGSDNVPRGPSRHYSLSSGSELPNSSKCSHLQLGFPATDFFSTPGPLLTDHTTSPPCPRLASPIQIQFHFSFFPERIRVTLSLFSFFLLPLPSLVDKFFLDKGVRRGRDISFIFVLIYRVSHADAALHARVIEIVDQSPNRSITDGGKKKKSQQANTKPKSHARATRQPFTSSSPPVVFYSYSADRTGSDEPSTGL